MVLQLRDLHVEFDTYGGVVKAVRGVNIDVHQGKTLAIVGESGCGKSVTVQSVMGLIPKPPGRITRGQAHFHATKSGKPVNLIGLSSRRFNQIRGNRIGMIFQDPMTSLNPTMTIGKQITETLRIHRGYTGAKARKRAIELLEQVQIPEAARRVNLYPFQFSGGMRQRAMIAMAIACDPVMLIADEPTTALDVTIQAQILELMKDLQRKNGMSIILITHDLGVVAKMADDVAVMYAGQVIEYGKSDDIFYHSAHPYTLGLRQAMPSAEEGAKSRLQPIDGAPPDLFSPPVGCGYYDRCPHAMKVCENHIPPETEISSEHHMSRCWLNHEFAPKGKLQAARKEAMT